MPATKNPTADLSRSAVPRYLQLAGLFRRRIETGIWQLNKQIPTVEELSSECGVARATIRQSLGLLEAEGLISRFRAKGTFVIKRPQDIFWVEVQTDWNGLLSNREGTKIEVLSDHPNQHPPMVPHPFGKLCDSYRHLRRRHWLEEGPFLLTDVFIDDEIATHISNASFSSLTAMRLVSQAPNVKIKDARQTLTIGAADIEIAELIKMPLSAPIAQVYRSLIDTNGKIVMISTGIYRGDIVRIDMQLQPQ